jgi:D-alanine-D-alanine ligase
MAAAPDRIAVGFLFGGRSGEHEVSITSARSLMRAADPVRYRVVPIGLTREGFWRTPAEDGPPEPDRAFGPGAVPVALWSEPDFRGLVRLSGEAAWTRRPLDVVFPVLHGTFGEDGTVQGLLEMAGMPYVGSGVLGSAAGMDKHVMKRLFGEAGLPQVNWRMVASRRWQDERDVVMKEIEEAFDYPVFVKPCNLGSSVGISKVRARAELEPAIDTAAQYDRKILIEEGVPAREIEVAVLGNEEPEASVVGEIVPCKEFYDYEAKYLMEGSRLLIPAPLDPAAAREVQRIAVRAFQVVDAAGLARVDFFVHKESGRVILNELNTMPGFTDISMYPKLWEASGLPYSRLIDRLIALGLERHAEAARLRRSR